MIAQERPVHVVLNGPDAQSVPLTDAEWEEHRAREAAAIRAEQDRTAQEAADRALITEKAQADPAFAALARTFGFQLPATEGDAADEPVSASAASEDSGAANGESGHSSGAASAS